jgi:hypothetical protein
VQDGLSDATGHSGRGPLVAFVGAGISSGAGLPLFDALRDELFAEVLEWPWMTHRTRCALRDGLRSLAPEYAVSLLDRDGEDPRGYVCDRLTNALPTAEHRLLRAGIASGATVYTPNFDDLIEAASADAITVGIRRTPNDPVGQADLYKLHGSCPQVAVTAEAVLLGISGAWADRFVDDCARPGAHLLVWGYKGVDPDLSPLVRQGAEKAARCTWVAFTEDDRRRAETLLRAAPRATVAFVDRDPARVLAIAQRLLDPNHTVTPDSAPPRTVGKSTYRLRRGSTRASALAHLGSARLGRRAWFEVALRGERDALRRLGRSYLFDSSTVQAVALAVLPRVIMRRPSVTMTNALLTASEGRGVGDSTDRVLQVVRRVVAPFGVGAADIEVRARFATLQRSRGRLADALETLAQIDSDLQRADSDAPTATWTGLLTYERAITHRLKGDVDAAQRVLASVDTANAAIVGANWSMWLEDEHCAIAVAQGRIDAAEHHLARARELAAAYGAHRLASVDLRIRQTQVELMKGATIEQALETARESKVLARHHRVLTPMRLAWIDGNTADAARRNGDANLALGVERRLLRSPFLPHRVAAAADLLLRGEHVDVDLSRLNQAIGETPIGVVAEHAMAPTSAAEQALADAIRLGAQLLFIS